MGFTGIRPYQGKTNKAFIEISYGYGNESCEMRRPLIVAEGYDPGLDKGKDGLGTNKLSTLSRDMVQAGQELGSALFYYDVVYVNWLNGTDDMHRNAYLLEDIIKWVNAEKALAGSSAPNVVMGQSMGGVIARYALRDMENRGENHDTWLYISHDAPHQGANIPQGIIEIANEVGFNIPSMYFALASMKTMRSNVRAMLQAPASKQLVKEINGSSNLFQEWQTELKNMGYPQQTRNIAISNGSGCGQKQDIDFKEQILDGYIPFKKKIGTFGGADVEAYASPNIGGTGLISYIRLYNRIRIGRMSSTQVFYKRSVNAMSYSTPLDTYAGGVYEFDLKMDGVEYKPFNFVPVTSAFDVGKGNVTLTEADYLKSYSPSDNPPTAKQIPFDNFIAPRTGTSIRNNQHISFNTQIGDWLAKEIKQETPAGDCSFICATDEQALMGNALICQTEVYQTSLNADSYQWQVIKGSDLVTLQVINNKKVALTRKNKSGLIVLQLRVSTNGCGEVTFTKEIWVGTRKPDGFMNVLVDPYIGRIKARVKPVEGAIQYNWYLDGVLITGKTNDNITVPIPKNNCNVGGVYGGSGSCYALRHLSGILRLF